MRRFKDKRLYERGESRFIWANVTNERGLVERHSTRRTNEKAATEWADEYERKAASPGYKRAAEATLSDAIADWYIELRRRQVSDATFEIAETKAGHFVRLWGEDFELSRITNDLVLSYIDTRAGEGRGTSPHTIKKELGALKGFLEWARFRGTFLADLATVIPPRYSSQHKPRTRWLTHEEAKLLLDWLDPHRSAHVAFILATGARRGEVRRAHRNDILLKDENPRVVLRGTKTDKAAGAVPITGITHPYIIHALVNAPGKDLLFPGTWGSMVRDLALGCERVGIAKASANDLRRSYGKWNRLAGVTAEHLSLLLRHTTDKLAQTTYGQITGADIGHELRQRFPILPEKPVRELNSETDSNGRKASEQDDEEI